MIIPQSTQTCFNQFNALCAMHDNIRITFIRLIKGIVPFFKFHNNPIFGITEKLTPNPILFLLS